MNNKTVTSIKVDKYLGVQIDQDLTFQPHVKSAIKKSTKMLGLIRKTFPWLYATTTRTLLKTMVHPYTKYGNVIWTSHTKRDCKEIENIQCRASSIAPAFDTDVASHCKDGLFSFGCDESNDQNQQKTIL